MDCASCAQAIEKGVAQMDGVERCELQFTTEKLNVSGAVSRAAVVERVRALGYDVVDETAPAAAPPPQTVLPYLWSRPETRFALLGALFLLPGLVGVELLQREHWLFALSGITAMVLAGWPVARSAWRAVTLAHEINMNVLMTIAAVGALFIGAFTEAGMIMVLFAIGEALEGFAAARARGAIRSLLALLPRSATRLTATGEETVPVEALRVGDRLIVRPGERIPMDGTVRQGTSSVNQAPLTGESRLVDKAPGDTVLASCINGDGVLEVTVTRTVADNTISRVIALVEEAQTQQAPVQRFVDRFARVYTPAVIGLALLAAAVPPLFFGQPFLNPGDGSQGWLYRALALLVVACPCALVISTPVSIISAISSGARQGILFKGGRYLEQLGQVRTMALDKTGTLTAGAPAVVDIRSAACSAAHAACPQCDDLLALAGAVELRSEHPLALAIGSAAARQGVTATYRPATNVRARVGEGIGGQVGTRAVFIGSHAYFDAQVPHEEAHCRAAAAAAAAGQTPLLVSVDGAYAGLITVADALRDDSAAAVARLREQGLALVMLSGDAPEIAARIGAEVGIDDVRGALLPADKLAAVRVLQQRAGPVAMVGDGINDTPALAAADIGIAIAGDTTTAQALETADVTLMHGRLQLLPQAVALSRAAMRTVHLNVALSIGIKLFFLALVLAGAGSMWLAVLGDVGTSLLVTLLGLRLLRWNGP